MKQLTAFFVVLCLSLPPCAEAGTLSRLWASEIASGKQVRSIILNDEFDNLVSGHNDQETALNLLNGRFSGGILNLANGGTGASSASGARSALGAAASGANTDITSLGGLTTALSTAQGGTGQSTYTDGQLLIGNTGTGSLTKTTLTAGSNITITNGAGSITVAATIPAIYPKRYLSGPPPTYSTANQIIVPAGLIVRDSADAANIEVASPITVDISASGAAGRCDGADSANQWNYVYLIRKSSDGTVSACFSTVNETVSGAITYPSGYDQKRQLPLAVRNNASADFIPFYISNWGYNPTITYDVSMAASSTDTADPTKVLDNGTSASFASVSLSSFVPPISRTVILAGAAATAAQKQYFRPAGSSLANGVVVYTADEATFSGVVVRTDASQAIEYKTSGSARLDVDVQGYRVDTGAF